jgi:hypothetical protein
VLINSARVLLKHAVLTGLALLVGVAVGVGAFTLVTPQQESTAQVLFVPSTTAPGVNGPTNPFLSLGGSVAITASLVRASVTDRRAAQTLYDNGAHGRYEVVPNLSQNAGPVLLVRADDQSAAMATLTLAAVLQAIKDRLLSLQVDRSVAKTLLINAVVLTASPHALPVRKAQMQVSILAGFGALAALLFIIVVCERYRSRQSGGEPSPGSSENVAHCASTVPDRKSQRSNTRPTQVARTVRRGRRQSAA